ncbi:MULTISPECIES: 3-phosphoshikimate 1-carboxyvinyltransferase [unclassified Microbacterium]|uniref:3-phosphoshikimate 1-carboxyvinyltransferase n=1 Tax=unclassified Microbacterium TaxID=2609290 RepID=UPI001D317814|nr:MULTISPECIES: 3-phosphoshikimate 1-carboxyvinyltransferase [unclassified Microbacterium]CAH0135600.1 3-phosphoshikimate 1-carboxyvinyltransferase [Microbacterium sp. Bi121]HWK77293.1 3-phosphoshikimate 1-carboxyvinyltransferase [Microbacterium sp.]
MSDTTYSPSPAAGAYAAPAAAGAVHATLAIPGSKSLTNRELMIAAIADGPGRLIAPLHSDDSRHMVEALRALGIGIEEVDGTGEFGPDLVITPEPLHGDATIDCGQAGTVMRFIAPLAGLAAQDVHLTAHESALHRPMGAMITALRDLGVDIDDEGTWSLPFTIRGHGRIRGGRIEIDASASSQFVSGLLLAAPRFDVGLHLVHTGEHLPSLPHIDMTIESLSRRGIRIERPAVGEWLVESGVPRAKEIAIEPDLSNAAPFLAAAMITGGEVSIPGWPLHSTQPGALLPDILQAMGAHVGRHSGTMTVRAGDGIRGLDLDLSAASELTPTIVGLAAFADRPTSIRGIGHIRLHETDRIAALIANLAALGGEVEELSDGLRVIPRPLHGGEWAAYHDHRIATTGALIGLRVPGVVVDDIGTTAKTLPEFTLLWDRMLAGGGSGA